MPTTPHTDTIGTMDQTKAYFPERIMVNNTPVRWLNKAKHPGLNITRSWHGIAIKSAV